MCPGTCLKLAPLFTCCSLLSRTNLYCILCSFLVLDAHVGWPGSSGDSTILQSRPFFKALGTAASFMREGDFIVGDSGGHTSTSSRWLFCAYVACLRSPNWCSHGYRWFYAGYALSPYVMTPYAKKRMTTSVRYFYNYMQSKCRRCVEQVVWSRFFFFLFLFLFLFLLSLFSLS